MIKTATRVNNLFRLSDYIESNISILLCFMYDLKSTVYYTFYEFGVIISAGGQVKVILLLFYYRHTHT